MTKINIMIDVFLKNKLTKAKINKSQIIFNNKVE